jgi:serine/threonine-protein kinase
VIGKQLDGKYEILSQLGAGAMGTVYEARNIHTGRTVAIKVIQGELGSDPALVARFQREARAAGAIESTHIAQVLDAGQDRATGAPYLVMELLKGEDLEMILHHLGAVRYGIALRIIAQALAGLERAHAVGVIHRDIKPANIYLARGDAGERVVKLVDFGIAKVKDDLGASKHALTQTSALLGSPLYMSPEQAKASKKVDGRADLWSLGIVLYQLLTGKAPHAHAESLTELLLAICTEEVKPVQDVAPWVPVNVAEVVEKALRVDPTKRYPTAKEMRDAIAAIVPDWSVLKDTMLTPMSPEERAIIADRASAIGSLGLSTGPNIEAPPTLQMSPALGGATVIDPMPAVAAAASGLSTPSAAASSPTGTETTGGTSGPTQEPKRKSRALSIAIAAIAVVGVIGGVGAVALRPKPNAQPPSAGLVASSSVMPAPDPAMSAAGVTPSSPSTTTIITMPPSSSASAEPSARASASNGTGVAPPGLRRPGTPASTPSATPPSTVVAAPPSPPSARPATPATPPTKPPTPPPSPSSPISREFN